jgi:ubiquinol-cytochrome c reductase iron-sulfur subunit
VLRAIWRWLLALFLWRRKPKPPPAPPPPVPDPSERELPATRRSEWIVVVALLLASAGWLAFVVLYVVHHADTQATGLALGLGFAFLALALIVAGKLVVPQETSVEEREQLLHEEEVEQVDQLVRAGGDGISRRRLLKGAGGVAGLTLAGAVAIPVASLGPNVGQRIRNTPWRRGRRLVDTKGRPFRPADIEIANFYTALPQNANPEDLGSPLVVVKLTEHENRLPPERRSWAPQNIVAYSKICTHAACAVSMYRFPTYQPTQPRPALVCPCHFSTFDPGDGGRVLFGPASRNLPQLPLMIDAQGYLAAASDFPDPIGPSWWDVDRTHGGTK